MTRSRLCVCGQPVAEKSSFCERHRTLFRQVGGAEPDPPTWLIVEATYAHTVMTVDEIAAALDCAPDDVRLHLHALRRANQAAPWLPGPMTGIGRD